MKIALGWFGIPALIFGAAVAMPGQAKKPPKPPTFKEAVSPTIKKYCLDCHTGKDSEAGIDLSKALARGGTPDDDELWTSVRDNIVSAHMPPSDVPKPSLHDRKFVGQAVDNLLASRCKVAGPGHVTLRRLNREEFDNTIRDLTGQNLHLADDFPSDDVGYGFDNIGDVLTVSPLLVEKYLTAAEKVADVLVPNASLSTIHKTGFEFSNSTGSNPTGETDRTLFTFSTVSANFAVPAAGEYRLKIVAHGDLAGDEPPKMAVIVDGKPVDKIDVKSAHDTTFEVPVHLSESSHKIGIRFLNDYYNAAKKEDRNLVLSAVDVVGPFDAQAPSSPNLVVQHGLPASEWDRAARPLLTNFAGRVFRRPADPEEIDRLMQVFDSSAKVGRSYEEGIKTAITAMLVSPSFLFRVELDPRNTEGKPRPLTDYELASRLSYFIWSSMPDQELLSKAGAGELHKLAVMKAEVERMIADPKASALADNFAGQWLQLRKLNIFFPDKEEFPEVDDAMKKDMATETKLFFTAVMRYDRSVIDFLQGRFSYMNERLAKLYGIPGIHGDAFRKVVLTDPNRAGILTQASVLSVTSNPTRTSPTKRGKWVLEEILGTPPPPPPPGVGNITNEKAVLADTTLRKLMEEHRKNPMCAACHAKMDPIGFGLENFDPVGRWRNKEGKFPVDASGVLPDGRKFAGPAQLRTILLTNKKAFVRCLADKLLTYALGRGMTSADQCTLDAIVKKTETGDYRFSALALAVVTSDPFLKQGGDGAKK